MPIKNKGKETVLFVEDETLIRELMSYAMRSYGYNVLPAKDGEEALDIYTGGQHQIDLVVSDMIMPKKGGIDLFKELKLINPDLKFILVTGYSLMDVDEVLLKKINAVRKKPYTPSEIAELAREILDR